MLSRDEHHEYLIWRSYAMGVFEVGGAPDGQIGQIARWPDGWFPPDGPDGQMARWPDGPDGPDGDQLPPSLPPDGTRWDPNSVAPD